jgi:hypothetical protein
MKVTPLTPEESRKYALGRCITPYCSKKRKGRYCHCCNKRRWRAKFPLKACFVAHRDNAIRRGKIHKLTFEYFNTFCDETNYLSLRGRTPKSLSIDRVINELGYIEGNIQAVTISFNSSKGDRLYYALRDKNLLPNNY